MGVRRGGEVGALYSFKWKCGLNRLQRAELSKHWGRRFDKPDMYDHSIRHFSGPEIYFTKFW